MNIILLSTYYKYPPDGGHSIRTYNTLKYLADGNNVFFLTFAKNKNDTKSYDSLKRLCKSADIFYIPDDFSKLRMTLSLCKNLFSTNPYSVKKYYRNDFKCKLREILQNNKIDIVHFDSLFLSCYLNDVKGVPVALTVHNNESLRMLSLMNASKNIVNRMFTFLQYKKIFNYEKTVCQKFDICLTVSHDDMSNLKKTSHTAKFAVIPNGVDMDYFYPGKLMPEPNSLIWVGGPAEINNKIAIDYFCKDIFPKIQKDVSAVKFTVIGKGSTKRLEILSHKYKNVKALGYVTDIRNHVNSSSVFIVPIKSGGGTKLKVLNALAMGKAVVTTSVGAEGIEVTDNENILIADDPETFARKTVELLRNPKMVERLGINAVKLIREKYDWKIIAKKHRQIYKEIVDESIHGESDK